MIPMKLLAAAAAMLAGGVAFASLPGAEPGRAPGVAPACWLQADEGPDGPALLAWSAPGIEADWTLSVRHRGAGYEQDQSGHVDGRAPGPVLLSRILVAPPAAMPSMRELMTRPAGTPPGTTVIAGSGLAPGRDGGLAFDARLRLYDRDGALICETGEI